MMAHPAFRPRAWRGFTLIELMVTVLIAAILLAIGIPSYTAQTRKSRRTDARTALLDLAAREERYNSTNNTYTSSPANLGYSGTGFPITVGGGYYQIKVYACAALSSCTSDAGTGTVFIATAQPVSGGSQANDTVCASFTLDSTGSQQVTGTASSTPSQCWN